MKNKYIFIIILILLWGCKKNINKSNDDLPSIYPLELSNVTKLDQYIDSIQIIPLETTEKSYITHIRKMLITPTGNFIIRVNIYLVLEPKAEVRENMSEFSIFVLLMIKNTY